MKKLIISFICIVILSCIVFGALKNKNKEYLRIHIRANSNLEIDQNIKYQIKDKVVEYLTPIIASCSSKQEMIDKLNLNKLNIENYIDSILKSNNFNYTSNLKINNELFPTRSYDNLTLESGYYDAIIIELGKAEGNNWWCVVYPPLCFLNTESYTSFKYKSKILELINKFKSKNA